MAGTLNAEDLDSITGIVSDQIDGLKNDIKANAGGEGGDPPASTKGEEAEFTRRVSTQVTDAVTQANVKVLAESPALSLSNLYQTISQTLSLSAQNAVTTQQQTNVIHQATTTQGVSLLYSIDTLSMGPTNKTITINKPETEEPAG
ncbi:RebB family R body protein [Moorena sp. SIO4G3]|uniref:RebB family R body protein n=1 Tax=Moorena sp. SIO4G3 TaxID=2607821 RepID=UPI00142A45CA|nr:RebB family R body protein [Moorena sp. SIO4G3]NEO78747.1 hypothetical protein [Moorena sp. SIO4G3]